MPIFGGFCKVLVSWLEFEAIAHAAYGPDIREAVGVGHFEAFTQARDQGFEGGIEGDVGEVRGVVELIENEVAGADFALLPVEQGEEFPFEGGERRVEKPPVEANLDRIEVELEGATRRGRGKERFGEGRGGLGEVFGAGDGESEFVPGNLEAVAGAEGLVGVNGGAVEPGAVFAVEVAHEEIPVRQKDKGVMARDFAAVNDDLIVFFAA